MKIIHTIANINRRVGGPSQSVTRLAVETACLGHEVQLLSIDYPELGPIGETPGVERIDFKPRRYTRPLGALHGSYRRALAREASSCTLIHNHGIWLWPNHYAARASQAHQVPLVISPRGMLGPWALSQNRFLKSLLWRLRERRDLRSASAFHATSAKEAEDLRQLGFRQPIAIIPNGVDLPASTEPDRAALGKLVGLPREKRLALFISRLHPKKGIEDLLNAWSRQDPGILGSWHLMIAGPDSGGYAGRIQAQIRQLGLESQVQLHREVAGLEKELLFKQAELFVLPTYEENFGIVVAEALAHGTAVITTTATPWEDLNTESAGICCPPGAGFLEMALAEALKLPSSDLKAMGLRGRAYVGKHFAWPNLAVKMALVYQWLSGHADKPETIATG